MSEIGRCNFCGSTISGAPIPRPCGQTMSHALFVINCASILCALFVVSLLAFSSQTCTGLNSALADCENWLGEALKLSETAPEPCRSRFAQ